MIVVIPHSPIQCNRLVCLYNHPVSLEITRINGTLDIITFHCLRCSGCIIPIYLISEVVVIVIKFIVVPGIIPTAPGVHYKCRDPLEVLPDIQCDILGIITIGQVDNG